MARQYSTAVRNAQGDAWESAIGPSAILRIWTGAIPPSAAAPDTGNTKLGEFQLASDWSAAASGGVKALNNLPLVGPSIGSGIASYYRFMDSTGTTCHEQGTVAMAGGDMTIDNTSVVAPQPLQVTAYSKTYPGA